MTHIPPRSRGTLRAQADHSYLSRAIMMPAQRFIHTEAIGGIVLLAATIAALTLANSPLASEYHHILDHHLTLSFGLFTVDLTIEEWINDGLMAIFFFVVGLEIKRRGNSRPAIHGANGDAARGSRSRRHGNSGSYLRRVQPRRIRRSRTWLGHPHGDRHRIRARRPGAARQAHPLRTARLHVRTRRGGRLRRHSRHSLRLHRNDRLRAAWNSRRASSSHDGSQPARPATARRHRRDRIRHLGRRAQVRRPRHRRWRADCCPHARDARD